MSLRVVLGHSSISHYLLSCKPEFGLSYLKSTSGANTLQLPILRDIDPLFGLISYRLRKFLLQVHGSSRFLEKPVLIFFLIIRVVRDQVGAILVGWGMVAVLI